MKNKVIFIGLLALAMFSGVSAADAYWGQGYFPYLSPYGGFAYGDNGYCGESIPYFALYPPVYYSYRIHRVEGFFPDAYNDGFPFASKESPSPRSQERFASTPPQPRRITNPFVERSNESRVAENQNPASRHPQIVYPAALASYRR